MTDRIVEKYRLRTVIQTVSTYYNRTPARVVANEEQVKEKLTLSECFNQLQQLTPLLQVADVTAENGEIVLKYCRSGLR